MGLHPEGSAPAACAADLFITGRPISNRLAWRPHKAVGRHGICHGCMDIIRVKNFVTGVKCSYEHTQYVVNLLPVAFLFYFSKLFGCIRRKWV